jgi:hypothetical protein
MTPAAVDKLVTARFDVAGPSLRAVFTDESSFEAYRKLLISDANQFFRIANDQDVSVTNIPKLANKYVGPFVIDENLSSNLKATNHCLRPLSPHIARILANKCDDHDKHKILTSGLFKYLIEEAVLEFGLGATVQADSSWAASSWELYWGSKVGGVFVSTTLPFPKWHRRAVYNSMSIGISVTLLEVGVVYCSALVNGELCDRLQVRRVLKDSAVTYHVYMYQVSALDPEKHSLSMELICHVLRKMDIFNHQCTMCTVATPR